MMSDLKKRGRFGSMSNEALITSQEGPPGLPVHQEHAPGGLVSSADFLPDLLKRSELFFILTNLAPGQDAKASPGVAFQETAKGFWWDKTSHTTSREQLVEKSMCHVLI